MLPRRMGNMNEAYEDLSEIYRQQGRQLKGKKKSKSWKKFKKSFKKTLKNDIKPVAIPLARNIISTAIVAGVPLLLKYLYYKKMAQEGLNTYE